jgi:hypothetical protein
MLNIVAYVCDGTTVERLIYSMQILGRWLVERRRNGAVAVAEQASTAEKRNEFGTVTEKTASCRRTCVEGLRFGRVARDALGLAVALDPKRVPVAGLGTYQIVTGLALSTMVKQFAAGCDQRIMLYQN